MPTEAEPKTAEQSANTLIAKALEAAGVPPRNINLPPETGNDGHEPKAPISSPYAAQKGETKGEKVEPEPAGTPEAETEPVQPPESDHTKEQPLSKTDVEAAINQATSKFQSIMDRRINQLQVQMSQTVNALNQFFQQHEEAGIAGLPKEEQLEHRLERLEKGLGVPKIQIQTQQPIDQQPTQFYQMLANFVDAVGLKIDDSRIDWAPDAQDPQTGFNRFLGSIKKTLVEDQTKAIKELRESGERELQKIRRKTGVDKVSTTGPSGPGLSDVTKLTPFEKINLGFQIQEQEFNQ